MSAPPGKDHMNVFEMKGEINIAPDSGVYSKLLISVYVCEIDPRTVQFDDLLSVQEERWQRDVALSIIDCLQQLCSRNMYWMWFWGKSSTES